MKRNNQDQRKEEPSLNFVELQRNEAESKNIDNKEAEKKFDAKNDKMPSQNLTKGDTANRKPQRDVSHEIKREADREIDRVVNVPAFRSRSRLALKDVENVIQIRVRYQETDQMGVVYHGNYFTWFEMGRTELLRQTTGVSYRDLEEAQTMMVIVSVDCSYHKPALYDDLLTLKTRAVKLSKVRLEHEYQLFRDQELLAVGHSVLATMDKQTHKIVPMPSWMCDAILETKISDQPQAND